MEFLTQLYHIVWGPPLLFLIIGVGIALTISLRGLQFRYLPYALKLALGGGSKQEGKGDISHFQSLMTALAGTIGIGNIAGVATGLAVGGVGALFWMWVTALIGMATKYAEALLALKYRSEDENGEMSGGPMYFIREGLGWKWLAGSFAFFGILASFGGGNMIQANSVSAAMNDLFGISPIWTGLAIAFCIGITLIGGIKSIGKVASILVPFMAFIYLGGGLIILCYHFTEIPHAFFYIVECAFSGQAAIGGFAGVGMITAMQVGVCRGLMTSEAGMGTASIAAAAAKSDVPGRQAMVSMTGSFLATVIMCTITGLVLSVTGVFGMQGSDGTLLTGASLTIAAFQSVIPWGGYIVSIGLILFGFTTLLGWAYYGEKCSEYLFGEKAIPYFRAIFTLVIIPGAVLNLHLVWLVSDIANGLMAFPNLIGILALSKVVVAETNSFLTLIGEEQKQMDFEEQQAEIA